MEQYREIYNQKYLSAQDLGWQGWGSADREEKGKKLVQRALSTVGFPKSGCCLEIGCGEGHITRGLTRKGYTVCGIDISDEAIKWAVAKAELENLNIEYVCQDIASRNFETDCSYGIVFDGNCLHCIPDRYRKISLENIYSVLKPDGVFFVSSRCSKIHNQVVYENEIEYRCFKTPENLKKELQEAGFILLTENCYERGSQVHLDILLKKC